MRCIIFLIFTFFTSFLSIGQDTTKVTIHNALQFISKETTICDHVADVFKPSGENKLIYINFGGKYPDNTFSAVIYPKDQSNFPYDPVEILKNSNICITGTISEYKGKAQMVIKVPTQILIQN